VVERDACSRKRVGSPLQLTAGLPLRLAKDSNATPPLQD